MTLPTFPPVSRAPRSVTLIRLAGEIARSLAPVGRIAVEGEVYRPSLSGGGRLYFTLRDRRAQVSVACPQGRASRCRAVAGERVCVVGTLNWTSEYGSLQLVAESVTPVGDGAVAAMIAESRRRLEAEGLLDRPKRPIPFLPQVIGVVCGTDAAVRKDIESEVASRFPGYPVRFEEAFLSGPSGAVSIIDALQRLGADRRVGVIVLARGGGDATQLLPFSDEDLCRAVCDSPVPVVSAIGHEGDRPLCDEVADLRCATPLAAAAAVVPDRRRLEAELAARQTAVATHFERRLADSRHRFDAIDVSQSLRRCFEGAEARLDRGREHLEWRHPRRQLEDAARRLDAIDVRAPTLRALAGARGRLDAVHWRRPVLDSVARAAGGLDADFRHLRALSPQRVLDRGYAVVRGPDGHVIRRAGDVAPGDLLDVAVASGRLSARVEEVHGG